MSMIYVTTVCGKMSSTDEIRNNARKNEDTTQIVEEIPENDESFILESALEMFSEFNEVIDMINSLENIINSQRSIMERTYEKFMDVFKQYQEQPHLLDSHIDEILEKMVSIVRCPKSSDELKHEIFKYMFVIVNVRGYKVIVRHLPHEIADFEPILQLLESQDLNHSDTWTTRYVLLLWLSIIVMIPFHMSRLDNSDLADNKNSVMCRVLNICKMYLTVTDKCRDAAAYLASKFLTRNDVKDLHLTEFFDWVCDLSMRKDCSLFVKDGTLSSVAMVLKHGKREDMLPHAGRLLQWIVGAEFKNNPGSNVQKLVYKLIQRIGLVLLPPRVVSWRYQRGSRSLATNLSAGDGKSRSGSTPTISDTQDDNSDSDIDVPDEVEEIIDQLIQGLRSGDSVVRWSAAKGIGRVTGRLPKALADDVVGSVLELFSARESDGAWQGGCLALAELGRRGLLIPSRLPKVVPLVLKALVYDEPRGYSSVGSHIRDSACYVCWSFARAYETHILEPFVGEIASALLVVTCFDREINCRRAASAAFQENVGRQGTFPHGIDILTTADFYAVSVRNTAFLEVSVFIARYDDYTLSLINHLLERKVDHWDSAIREVTAKALHNLTPMAPEYMLDTVLPKLFEKCKSIDLNTRHGSILAISEIIHSLSCIAKKKDMTVKEFIGENILNETRDLIPMFRERQYFRGLGGEMMRQACSDFIHKCSLAHLPFHKMDIIDDWLKLLDECLLFDVPNVRANAISALPAFFAEYYRGDSDEIADARTAIVIRYARELLSTGLITRMSHALAMGCMPGFMLKQHFEIIFDSLVVSTDSRSATEKWAESRRDAVKALSSVCTTLDSDITIVLTQSRIKRIYDCFLRGLTEYTQDNRGDIGAWVREASVSGLQTVTLLLNKYMPDMLDSDLIRKIMAGIAQQAVEKIDRTRALAGKVFYNLIHSDPKVPHIPNHDQLIVIFDKDECRLLNWHSAAITFPKFVNLIEFNDYKYSLLLGLVSSVGGMTETLVKNSSHSFFEILNKIQSTKGVAEIANLCDIIHQIFVDHHKINRIILTMFRFLDKLFSSGCITCIVEDTTSEFPQKIFKLVQLELNGCRDLYKLIDGICVLCQFIQVKSNVSAQALVQLSIYLCHRQSYVRRSTATKLFESLLIFGDNTIIPVENLDEIMNILSSTNWEEPVNDIKPIRNKLCTLMGVRIPIPRKNV